MVFKTALALLLLTPAGALLAPSAAHAAATCHGLPATIEGSSGKVSGTPGPDVIVGTDRVESVEAGDGDDLVCLVSTVKLGDERHVVFVDAGAGADVVDVSQAGAKTSAVLGLGADTFTGSRFNDAVRLNGFFSPQTAGDPGPDVVTTGAGKDSLVLASGTVVTADLGPGDDGMAIDNDGYSLSYAGPGSSIDLGAGHDSVRFQDWWEQVGSGETSLRVDLVTGRAIWRDVTFPLRGAEDVAGYAQRITLIGNARPNRFTAPGCQVVVKGGGGADRISVKNVSVEEASYGCHRGDRTTVHGQGGDDTLYGGTGHEVLIGGAGYDVVNGGARGHDRCEAERIFGAGCRR